MKKQIKITLKCNNSLVGNPMYKVTKLVNAATVNYPNPENIRETQTLRVGDDVNEKVATALVDMNHEVTVV